MREVLSLTDLANEYISKKEPWRLNKDPKNKDKVISICSMGMNLFRLIIIYLKPVTPVLAERSELLLNEKLYWESAQSPSINHKINEFEPLLHRIQKEDIKSMLDSANGGSK